MSETNIIINKPNNKEIKITHYSDLDGITIEYFKDGELHRDEDKPACINLTLTLNMISYEYFKNGKKHRDNDKPAETTFQSTGELTSHEFYQNGLLHRDDDKPATQFFMWGDPSKSIDHYYKNGEEYTPEDSTNAH
jgi:hypothetical protein